MTSIYEFTDTARSLAYEQHERGNYQKVTASPDRNGNENCVEMVTPGGDMVVIYTYMDGPQEFLVFTTYLKGSEKPHNTGGCSVVEAPKLLRGLSRFYSE